MNNVLTQCPQCRAKIANTTSAFCVDCRFPLRPFDNRFLVKKKLAQGGFGVVYIAEDLKESGVCALKVIKFEGEVDSDGYKQLVKRFLREVKVTSKLAKLTPLIIRIFAHGDDPNYGMYYAMELLKGRSLEEELKTRKSLPIAEGLEIFRQLCIGMQIAHEQNVVHRDLKPDNIFLIDDENGRPTVKILDFGIAKNISGTVETKLTNGVIGTPHYLAPEQCSGQDISSRSDIYSMGIILFELLTGRVPFNGQSIIALITAHIMTKPPAPSSVRPELNIPKSMDAIVLKALEKEPQRRFATPTAFWKVLEPLFQSYRFVGDHPIHSDEAFDETGALSLTGSLGIDATADLGPVQNEGIESKNEAFLETSAPSEHLESSHAMPMPASVSSSEFMETASSAKWGWIGGVGIIVLLTVTAFSFVSKPNHQGTRGERRVVRSPRKAQGLKRHIPPRRREQKRHTPEPKAGSIVAKKAPTVRPERVRLPAPRRKVITKTRRIKTKRKRMLRVRRVRPQRARPSKKRHICGGIQEGRRWIIGQFAYPSMKDIKTNVRVRGCMDCLVKRSGERYCLDVPKGKSVRLQVKAVGFQTCKHSATASRKRIVWRLKLRDPNGLVNPYYKCSTSQSSD